ncbi:glycoside hydrolase family 28 protein [Chitinophaga vietnamensis]|uniref:glycoside hydrolase family 28 protein n=1 Tax=Chitinophaga vietnamensis TaxID=2593957 RepID=UPI001376208C|nr:glycosyl hydrolase family 28 protein [Chitinophaga vietnamensis]
MKPLFHLFSFILLAHLSTACNKTSSVYPEALADTTSFLITRFGAVGDGHVMNTTAIQSAIDACTQKGGGIVVVPKGTFLTGTIYLKSGVTLYVQAGGTLLGSPYIKDYPINKSKYHGGNNFALIAADDAQNIGISGPGTIDGQGGSRDFMTGADERYRPKLVYFIHCQHIKVHGIQLHSAADWVQYYFYCQDVHLDSVSVYSYANLNNDGIDIDAQDVTITNCHIQSEDDGICLKSNAPVPCRNVQISNCTVASDCNSIKMGTGSTTGFININIQNCTVSRPPVSPFFHWQQTVPGITDSLSAVSGLALEMVDGGLMSDISISHINMTGIQTPIFIKLGDRSRMNPDSAHMPGTMRNILISDINAVSVSKMSSSITGWPGNYVQQVVLRNIFITCPGGGNAADASHVVIESQGNYPENRMFGASLPAYGLYVRHAQQITLDSVFLGFSSTDVRPAVYLEDVNGLNGKRVTLQPSSSGGEAVKVVNSSNVSL